MPTLGGEPKLYLEGVAEYDWSRDGTRLAYHTPGPGDPLFVSDGTRRADDRPIFTAPRDFTVTSSNGRRTGLTSILCKAHFLTNSISGEFGPVADRQNESRLTMHA